MGASTTPPGGTGYSVGWYRDDHDDVFESHQGDDEFGGLFDFTGPLEENPLRYLGVGSPHPGGYFSGGAAMVTPGGTPRGGVRNPSGGSSTHPRGSTRGGGRRFFSRRVVPSPWGHRGRLRRVKPFNPPWGGLPFSGWPRPGGRPIPTGPPSRSPPGGVVFPHGGPGRGNPWGPRGAPPGGPPTGGVNGRFFGGVPP